MILTVTLNGTDSSRLHLSCNINNAGIAQLLVQAVLDDLSHAAKHNALQLLTCKLQNQVLQVTLELAT